MSEVSVNGELKTGDAKPSFWSRVTRAVLPDRIVRRWDRLPEGSQKDAAHYNMRSGL
jgi:hypothetical protein